MQERQRDNLPTALDGGGGGGQYRTGQDSIAQDDGTVPPYSVGSPSMVALFLPLPPDPCMHDQEPAPAGSRIWVQVSEVEAMIDGTSFLMQEIFQYRSEQKRQSQPGWAGPRAALEFFASCPGFVGWVALWHGCSALLDDAGVSK